MDYPKLRIPVVTNSVSAPIIAVFHDEDGTFKNFLSKNIADMEKENLELKQKLAKLQEKPKRGRPRKELKQIDIKVNLNRGD